MKFRTNQLIASEGALSYKDENGKEVFKMKKWDKLKTFIGKKVPIVDEHPPSKVLTGFEKIYGTGTVKQCPDGRHALCADMQLDDNAPKKSGYSLGYPYEQVNEEGTHKGKTYTIVQDILGLNHIALTNYPRNNTAIAVTGDSEDGKKEVIKYFFAMDSFSNNEINSNLKREKNKMTDSEKDLIAEVATLKATLATKDKQIALEADSRKASAAKDKEIEELKRGVDSLKKANEKLITDQAKFDMDSIMESYPKLDKELFKGATPESISLLKRAVDSIKTMAVAKATFEEVDSDENGNYSLDVDGKTIQGSDNDQLTWNPEKEVFE